MSTKTRIENGRIVLNPEAFRAYPIAPVVTPAPLTRPTPAPGYLPGAPQVAPGRRTVTHTVTTTRTVTETRTETVTEEIEPAPLPDYEPPYTLVRGIDPSGGPRWRDADGRAMTAAEEAEAKYRIATGQAEIHDYAPGVPWDIS